MKISKKLLKRINTAFTKNTRDEEDQDAIDRAIERAMEWT